VTQQVEFGLLQALLYSIGGLNLANPQLRRTEMGQQIALAFTTRPIKTAVLSIPARFPAMGDLVSYH